MSAHWNQVKDLFAACADLDAESQRKRLDAAPEDVRREVMSLLAAEEKAGAFLGGWPHVTRLGAYELIGKIGEGGMGAVWEARRVDGQFEHRAAIKIIREHCDSPANLERFRAERQLLAQLDHPNITRLLDGGATPGGLPYFVMELIEGARIDAYCRDLTVEQKLHLLLPVCEAVDYANRRGVLHRDLKPANILVTAEGAPKLVDFGIAKAIGDATPITTTIHRIATPEYASPEHLTGRPLTAASEVYSLGVTAYELLTGVKPYSGLASSLPELVRAVCESAPRKPSSVSNLLSADIDNILAKAMHKDPERRYPSAGEMARDIERSLAGQPVLARGDSITYQMSRFVRRNRKGAAAAAAAFVLGGAAWGLWSYMHVRRFTHRSIAVIGIRGELKDPSLEWLDRGVLETLSMSLQHSGAFHVISADRIRVTHGGTAEEVARALGTELYVDGVLTGPQWKIRLDLRVHETATGRVVFAGGFDAPSREAVFLLADQAVSQIAGRLTTVSPSPIESKRLLTGNNDALRAYEEAGQERGKWRMAAAVQSFRKAIELDPEFTMAYVGLAETAGLTDRIAARGAILRAADLAASRRLPKFSTNLIQGLRLYFDGRIEDAAEVLRALASEFPQETDPVFWEGQAHMSSLRFAEARASFEQVTLIDPGHVLGWLMLAQASGLQGAHDAAHTAGARYCRLIGDNERNCYGVWGDLDVYRERWDEALEQYRKAADQFRGLQASVLWLRGDSAAASRVLAKVDSADAAAVDGNAAAARGDLAAALDLYEKSASLYRNPAFSYQQLLKAAEIWLETGRPQNVLSMAARHEGPWVPGIAATAYLVLGNGAAAEAEFTAMRAALTPRIGEYLASRTEDFHRLLGAFYRGDHQSVAAGAARLPRRFSTFSSIPVGRSMLELGRLTEARERLEVAWLCRLTFSGPELFEEHSGLRVILAEFYQGKLAGRQGRREDARRWLASFLRHFPAGRNALPQMKEAREILATL